MREPEAVRVRVCPDGPLLVTGEAVVVAEDGGQLRIPLVHRHGAWWAP